MFALLAARSSVAGLEGVPPLADALPPATAASWHVIDGSWHELADAGVRLEVDGEQVARGRVDIFHKSNGTWRWAEARSFTPTAKHITRDVRGTVGVLLRAARRRGRYAFAECDTGKSSCSLNWYRTIRRGPLLPGDASVALFAEAEPQDLSVVTDDSVVSFVPDVTGVICAYSDQSAACGALAKEAETFAFDDAVSLGQIRLMKFQDECVRAKVVMYASGHASSRPRDVPVSMNCAGSWAAVRSESFDDELRLDIEVAPKAAVQRFSAGSLARLPAYTNVGPPGPAGFGGSPQWVRRVCGRACPRRSTLSPPHQI